MKYSELFDNRRWPITLENALSQLQSVFDKTKKVYFAHLEDGECYGGYPAVNSLHSWRGSYEYPSCGTSGNKPLTASQLIEVMEDFLGSTQYGYKGGEYTMYGDGPLWADDDGCCREYGVDKVVECEEGIFFVTKKFEY